MYQWRYHRKNMASSLATIDENLANETKRHQAGNGLINGDCSEIDLEIEALRDKLQKARFALAQTQTQMELHRIRTGQVVMAWRIRIHEAEERLRLHRRERDIELKDITAQLLFFEGQLKREQQDIRTMLNEKDKVIAEQQTKIKELRRVNADLHRELEYIQKNPPNGLRVELSKTDGKTIEGSQVTEKVTSVSYRASRGFRKPKKTRVSSSFHRSFSLPSCMNSADISDLMSESSCQLSDVDDNAIMESCHCHRLQGQRESLPTSRSRNAGNCDDVINRRNMSRSEQNLSTSSEFERRRRHYSDTEKNVTPIAPPEHDDATGVGAPARDQISEKKSESSRDRIKRAFMRPRDVKKRSKMRVRSTSLKDNNSKEFTSSKRFFSFTF